jgi:glyoxylase-like metal-dependent hydrolase (beta-lactamase superfamily II)
LGIKVRQQATMVDLTFLGTRGELAIRSRRHRRHSSLLIQYNDARIMIDCGADWLGRLSSVAPTAIVLTHAHPDHAWGLAKGPGAVRRRKCVKSEESELWQRA